jgi:nucleoside-diphosphate-sugar epimerase
VRGFDRVPTPGTPEHIVGSLTDPAAVGSAMQGAEALIHLAATPDDADFMSELLPNNIIGLYHVLEAARNAAVKRLVLASTGQVIWWQQQEGPLPVSPTDGYTPKHWYAATKVMLEAAARSYARDYGLTVLVVRLGWCPRTFAQVDEIAASPMGQDTYFSPGDAGRFFAAALQAPLNPGCHFVFAASKPVHQAIFDLEPTKMLLNWVPKDQWPTGATDDARS